MEESMLKIDNVSKLYKLGQIGGTTLRDELQRFSAKLHGKEDPTKRIGAKDYNKGETFMALDGVSFEVKKGERVGIIGHNGAGKSTLLKLISRVTAPTGGTIGLNGRVASMLEVGTGFHGELTGRENIYMNGAILGMTKKEIDAKMEDIIEFSECRQFIDTPVKRYSSGMYVKLAFSVAAHLDSEIMIMDEVLAVGDAAFQKKCLQKMRQVSQDEDKTVLYVSHNMNTIRQLCDRVIVMDHGKIILDGDAEDGIAAYLGNKKMTKASNFLTVSDNMRDPLFPNPIIKLVEFSADKENAVYSCGEKIECKISIFSKKDANVFFRVVFFSVAGDSTLMCYNPVEIKVHEGVNELPLSIDISRLVPGSYYFDFVINEKDGKGIEKMDAIKSLYTFTVIPNDGFYYNLTWDANYWGRIYGEVELRRGM